MIQELKFALYTLGMNIKSSAELRTSFVTNILGMMFNNAAFVVIWIFFIQSVGVINGWQVVDIIALQAFSSLSYGIGFFLFTGFRELPAYVSSGVFDRFLVSPKNLLLRVAVSITSVSTIGDILFGVIAFCIYIYLAGIGAMQLGLMVLAILFATVVFTAVIVSIYSLSFWFMDAGAVTQGLLDFFLTPSLFHGGAFQGAMRFVFTFIIPSLLIGTIPTEAVRDLSLNQIGLMAVMAFVWSCIAFKLFYIGVKKYESANMVTFGI